MLDAIRKQIRKIAPESKISNDEINDILINNVIKRDVFEGEKSAEAKRRLQKFIRQQAKQQAAKEKTENQTE